jgi:Zn finger protein HypA/HybF involved in hydrogenase expression
MSKYSELLKHPKWQQKRLEILKRDKWTCKGCGDKESTLHVHHFTYQKNKNPWEYSNDNFITLCEVCHSEEEQFLKGENLAFVSLSRVHKASIRKMLSNSICLTFISKKDHKFYKSIIKKMNDFLDKNSDDYDSFCSKLS